MNQIIHELQDMTYLSWAKIRNSSGTAGSFLKAYSDLGGIKTYYKLSNYDAMRGIVGHECVNEIIVDRLLTLLGVEHLHYQLIHALVMLNGNTEEVWLCASEDFKKTGESKIALDAYYQAEQLDASETPLQFCIRNGWEDYIYTMLVIDFLILNRDRHGANIEVLRNRRRKTIRLAPLFDHGLSFVFRCETEEALAKEDVLSDKPVQCYVGSRSAWENLRLIPADKHPKLNTLQETDKDFIMAELENILPKAWQDKIWDMIWRRWQAYENLRNQR